jgi:hypothetical protein
MGHRLIWRTRRQAFRAVGGFFRVGAGVERQQVQVLLDDPRVEPGELTVTCTLGGDETGAWREGTLFTVEVTPVASGTTVVDFTASEVLDGDAEALSGLVVEDGFVTTDVTPPEITEIVIENLTLAHTDAFIKDGDAARMTATVTDSDPAMALEDIEADLTALAGPGNEAVLPDSYEDGVAIWEDALTSVVCDPSDGVIALPITAADPLGNEATEQDTLTADNTLPEPGEFDATPGHEKIELVWSHGTDDHFSGTTVRRTSDADEYPFYDLLAGAWPDIDGFFAGDAAAGDEITTGIDTAAVDVLVDRNIYYYQAFTFDHARNYSLPDPVSRDFATNYWLGDVAAAFGSWGYSGYVNDADMDKFGGTYNAGVMGNPPPTGNNAECDIGPTVNPEGAADGVPLTDDAVEFEDLMTIAMNYMSVSPRVIPALPETPAGELRLVLADAETGGEAGRGGTQLDDLTLVLRLEGNVDEVKGLSALLEYDASRLAFRSATLADGMAAAGAEIFYWSGSHEGQARIDLAALGTGVTLGGSGDVATLRFGILEAGEIDVELAQVRLRDVTNRDLGAEIEGYVGFYEEPAPTTYAFLQNAPNPFNPKTAIAYHVPETARVAIRVYNVNGQLVRTLVDAETEPGRYEAVWDGRDGRNEVVAGGVYFCTMEAGSFESSRKMILLK